MIWMNLTRNREFSARSLKLMKKLILLALVLGHVQLEAQTVDPRIESVVSQFEQHYNSEAYERIFKLFNPSMQAHLPHLDARQFFSALQEDAGKMMRREAIREKQDQVTYKATFQKGVFALHVSLDKHDKISGFLIKPYFSDSLPKIERNTTALHLPFRDAWMVAWGGDNAEQNYHVDNQAQQHAFDFIVVGQNGKTHRTDGRFNEDYYAFGKEIIAPVDGVVVTVVDGIKDNVPGEMNPLYIPGNTVIIKTALGEHLVLAHFKQYSIVVRVGDKVSQGQLLGLCGNSGNSSEPHLHFHLQNVEEMYKATGAKLYFEQLLVNGELKQDYSPEKGQLVRPTGGP